MCENKSFKCCNCQGASTCDCAEERDRLARLAAGLNDKGEEEDGGSKSMKKILGLAGLTVFFGGLLFRRLDRKTQHKLLSMIGLGFLIQLDPEKNPYCDPCPVLNPAAMRFPRAQSKCETEKKNTGNAKKK